MVEKVHRDSSKKVKNERDNMTEVSVVIPTKNEEKSIGKCIEKIQTLCWESDSRVR